MVSLFLAPAHAWCTRQNLSSYIFLIPIQNKFEIQHRSACESTATFATAQATNSDEAELRLAESLDTLGSTLTHDEEYFISETVLNCNKARWKAFTYHTKLNCFGSGVRVSAAQVKERKMRACKYCVPDESTGEPLVVSQRRIISQLAAAEAERVAKVTKIVFGDETQQKKQRNSAKSKTKRRKLDTNIRKNQEIQPVLVTPVKLTVLQQAAKPPTTLSASAEFCLVETSSGPAPLLEEFNTSDLLLDDDSGSRSDDLTDFGGGCLNFGLEELSSTDPTTSTEEPASPWFAPLSPTAEFNGLNVSLPNSYVLSPFWSDGSTY